MTKNNYSSQNLLCPQILHIGPSQSICAFRHVHRTKHESNYDMHYSCEFGIVLSGKMRRHYREHNRDWSMDISAGEIWLCGMWEPHGYEILQAPCEIMVILVKPEILAKLRFEESPEINWLAPFVALPELRPKINKYAKSRIFDYAERLLEAFDVEIESRRLCMIRLLLLEIILTLFENWEPPNFTEKGAFASFARINDAIEMTFRSNRLVTTEAAAGACNINRKTFSRLFREMMGIRYSEFNLRYRINKVTEQLLHTDDPVKKIAIDWGFVDASHLHNSFIKYYGCSPKKYRDYRERTPKNLTQV